MSWFGGIVLGLGAVLVAVLAAVKIMRIVRRRGGFPTKAASYADRLDLDAENGAHDEINQMAEALIREHGPSAVIEAARRSISKLDDGDLITNVCMSKCQTDADCPQDDPRKYCRTDQEGLCSEDPRTCDTTCAGSCCCNYSFNAAGECVQGQCTGCG